MAEEEAKPANEEQAAAQAEEAEAVKKKGAGEGAPAGPNPKLILIVLALNAVVLVVLALVVWKSYVSSSSQVSLADVAADKDGGKADAKKEGGEKKEGEGKGKKEGKEGEGADDNFINESFTVNLADSRGAHFAKVDVAIEVDDDFVKMDVKKLRPKIRDFINVVLSSKTYDQIESTDGREFLREEIRNKINGYLSRGQIKNVFFTSFIVQ